MAVNLEDLNRFVEDPATSWTLPGRYYFDPDIYARVLSCIFYRTWQYPGHEALLPETGSYLVGDIGVQMICELEEG